MCVGRARDCTVYPGVMVLGRSAAGMHDDLPVVQEFGVPLPDTEATVVEKSLSWNDIEYDTTLTRVASSL